MSTILPSCVDVTGTGTASATPDMVHLDLRITHDGSTVSSTLHELGRIVARVQDSLRAAGIADTDIATASSGIHQRYDNQGQPVQGFSGFHSLKVGVRDLDQVSAVVDQAVDVADNGLLIDGINLAIADPAPLLATARQRAFADATSRAEEYATFAGRTLGEVIWIGDTLTGGPEPRMYALRAGGATESAMPISPGESTVSAQVSVRFAWGGGHTPHQQQIVPAGDGNASPEGVAQA